MLEIRVIFKTKSDKYLSKHKFLVQIENEQVLFSTLGIWGIFK